MHNDSASRKIRAPNKYFYPKKSLYSRCEKHNVGTLPKKENRVLVRVRCVCVCVCVCGRGRVSILFIEF
jgi:hypothetical protein